MSIDAYNHELAIDKVVNETNELMSNKSLSNSTITNKLKAVGLEAYKEMSYVFGNLNTLSNKMTAMRNAIADNCPRHHMFNKRFAELVKSNKWLEHNCAWSDATNPKTISAIVREVSTRASRMAETYDQEKKYDKRDEYLEIVTQLKSLKVFAEPYYHFKLTQAQTKQIKDAREERVNKSHQNQITVGKAQIISITRKLLASSSHYDMALGLALATGRRMSEIYFSAKFEYIDEFKLSFAGQLKKKFWQGDKDIEYFMYTTIPASEVLEAFDRFRNFDIVSEMIGVIKESGEISLINRKFSKGCSRAAKAHLGKLDGTENWRFSDSRAIWGRIVFESHFSDEEWATCSEERFWQCMYGHEDLSTQNDYKRYKLVKSKPLSQPENKKDSVVTMESLVRADEEVIESADYDRLGFKPDLLIKAHTKTKLYIEQNGEVEYKKSFFYKTEKQGGLGLTRYVSDAYLKILTKYIK
ncbi:protelomerase family protein [Vibrio parahaemolyticus]|nr:protelomerase family protein [Vibrio parahaemolyticus]